MVAVRVGLAANETWAARQDEVVVLHDGSSFPRPPCRGCMQHDARAPLPEGAYKAVIVSGHSGFGAYVGLSTYEVGRTIAMLSPTPEFIIFDTCFGAQAELLLALDYAGVRPGLVVASADAVAPSGFDYGELFATEEVTVTSVIERVRDADGGSLSMFNAADIPQLREVVAAQNKRFAGCEGFEDLVAISPNLVRTDSSTLGKVLVHIPGTVVASCFAADRVADELRWIGLGVFSLLAAAVIGLQGKRG